MIDLPELDSSATPEKTAARSVFRSVRVQRPERPETLLYTLILASTLVLGAAATANATLLGAPQTECHLITIADAAGKGMPTFASFPAQPVQGLRPVPVNVNSHPRAKLYRTRIREGAAAGPNFAGHFTIVGWGCGAGCLQWAVVSARTGAVYFPPDEIAVISTVHVGTSPGEPEPAFDGLRFHLDSALLMILGAPHEDESREGILFYQWTGKTFRFVRAQRVKKVWCP